MFIAHGFQRPSRLPPGDHSRRLAERDERDRSANSMTSNGLGIQAVGRNARVFYGWWIVLVAFICHAVNTGMIFYAWGVFFRPLAEAFGGHAPVASGFSALQFAAAGYSLLVGRAVDRHGARPVEIVGALVRQLATCRWVHDHHNVLITGMTGTGKSYLACALAQQACRRG